MAQHNELGKKGEELARRYLEEQHIKILACNWRKGRAEIDIVGLEEEEMLFIEVKTRSTLLFGEPMDAIDVKKMQRLYWAAIHFMEQFGHEGSIRFDVVSVLLSHDNSGEIRYIRDAFFPDGFAEGWRYP